MDCIIIGFNEPDLEKVIQDFELMKKHSGAYHNLLQCVGQLHGRWMHYTNIFNEIVSHTDDKYVDLHPMQMPNLAVCYLKSFLEKRSFDVEMINFFNTEKERLECLLQTNPTAVAITTTYYITDSPVRELVRFIKKINSEVTIIIGGPYIFNICLASQDITTQNYIFDKMEGDIFVNSSQGEHTLSKVLSVLKLNNLSKLHTIPNLMFRSELQAVAAPKKNDDSGRLENQSRQFIRTSLEPERNDLSTNCIDWSLFNKSFYTPTTFMRTARGCPFECAFCSYPTISGGLTYSNIESIEQEMKQLSEDGVENLVLIDDSFNVPPPRFKKILRMMISNNFRFNWFSFFRCSHSDDEVFDLMEQSGCRGVFLGIESGDQSILDKMNKKVKVDQYKTAIRKLHDHGIFTFASLIVGFPGETEDSIQNTISFLQETRPTFFKAELYFHTHYVPIHQQAEKYDLRGSGFGWHHNSMDWQTACKQIDLIYNTVKESHVCPVYMFDFWTIPYLLGKGITLEQIKRFLSLCRPLLQSNLDATQKTLEEKEYELLLNLGKEVASALQSSA